eukprot:jgi/Bigna1/52728/estExt_Genewise1Plus.C_100190
MCKCGIDLGSFFKLSAKNIDGENVDFKKYNGNVCYVANAMTGFAKKYHKDGFCVLAFPCNQFGRQEPGTDAEIKEFVRSRYGLPEGLEMFSKIKVNGPKTHPVYEHLKTAFPGDVSWNFMGHFLIGRDGQVKQRFGRTTSYATVDAAIQKELKTEKGEAKEK